MIATAPALTERGKSLLMRAIGGEKVTFMYFEVGSGTLPDGETGENLNALIHREFGFNITDMDNSQEGLLTLTGEFDNGNVEDDFPWRELGIFAKGEDDEVILYAYSNDGANASIVRKLNTDVITIQTVTMLIAIGEAENVTAVYSPHRQYALAEDLTTHITNINNPHKVTKAQVGLGNVQNATPANMTVTFTEAEQQANIASGESIGTAFGKIKKAFTALLAHLSNTENPHGVTRQQIEAASDTHTHTASDITSGTVPLERGGTGVNTLAALRNEIGTNAIIAVYTGDGTVKRGVNVGFIPSAVILCDDNGQVWDETKGIRGGVAVGLYGIRRKDSTSGTHSTVWNDDYTALLPGSDDETGFAGFWVNEVAGTDGNDSISTNENGHVYHYIAYR